MTSPIRQDFSILPKILSEITLSEWFEIHNDIVRFHKSKLMEFNIEDSIYDCLQKMNEKGLTHIGVMNSDRT